MTGLLRAEVRRLFARRVVRLFVALALLVILIVYVRAFVVSDRNVAAAHRRAAAEAQRLQQSGFDPSAKCEAEKSAGRLPPDVECPPPGAFGPPDADQLFQDPRFHARQYVDPGARGVAVGIAIIAFIIGATFVGAEWNAGTMQALLFWEPRRKRVLLAKALALVGGMVAVTVAFEVVVFGLTMFVGATRGTTEGVTSGLRQAAALSALRGLGIVSFTALLGYAVAGLARVTAASLGVAFGYFVILENLMRVLRPGWQRFLVSENISAVLVKTTTVSSAHAKRLDQGFSTQYTLHATRGAITLAVYLVILLGAFAVTFSRRDVT